MKVHPRRNHVLVRRTPEPERKILIVTQPTQPALIRGLVMELGPFANVEVFFSEEPDEEYRTRDTPSEEEKAKARMKEKNAQDQLHVGDEVLFPMGMEHMHAMHLTIDKEDWYLVPAEMIVGVIDHEEDIQHA
jgi:hypothetical protein